MRVIAVACLAVTIGVASHPAAQELGLKLVATRGLVDVLVIDSAMLPNPD
jgi:hypothetical protein